MRAACDIAQRLELESERPHKAWLKDGSSFRMGLEMADILGELRLDQPALEAAVLYRAVRERLIGLEEVEKRFGNEVAGLIDGVLQMAAISPTRCRPGPQPARSAGQPAQDAGQHDRRRAGGVDQDRRAHLCVAAGTRRATGKTPSGGPRGLRYLCATGAPAGIGHLKWELEDLSFRYLHEDDYKAIARQLAEKRLDRDRYIHDVVETLKSLMDAQAFVIRWMVAPSISIRSGGR